MFASETSDLTRDFTHDLPSGVRRPRSLSARHVPFGDGLRMRAVSATGDITMLPGSPIVAPAPRPVPLARVQLVQARMAAPPEPEPARWPPAGEVQELFNPNTAEPPVIEMKSLPVTPAIPAQKTEEVPPVLRWALEATGGLLCTWLVLLEYAELSLMEIFGGEFGGPVISLAVAVFLSLLLLGLWSAINLVHIRKTRRWSLFLGACLAFPVACWLTPMVQDGLTVFGYYFGGGRGVHPVLYQYHGPSGVRGGL